MTTEADYSRWVSPIVGDVQDALTKYQGLPTMVVALALTEVLALVLVRIVEQHPSALADVLEGVDLSFDAVRTSLREAVKPPGVAN